MSTRACIAVQKGDGTYDAVYLHFDGYPEHAGETLMQHYATATDAEALVAGGDLRCLDRKTGEPQRFVDGKGPAILPTRDVLIQFARGCGVEYLYVFDDGAWACEALLS